MELVFGCIFQMFHTNRRDVQGPRNNGTPYPYYSHTTPIRIPKYMGVPGITLDLIHSWSGSLERLGIIDSSISLHFSPIRWVREVFFHLSLWYLSTLPPIITVTWKNASLQYDRFLSFRVISHWTMIMGEMVWFVNILQRDFIMPINWLTLDFK